MTVAYVSKRLNWTRTASNRGPEHEASRQGLQRRREGIPPHVLGAPLRGEGHRPPRLLQDHAAGRAWTARRPPPRSRPSRPPAPGPRCGPTCSPTSSTTRAAPTASRTCPGDDTCFYAFIAYPIDLFEEGLGGERLHLARGQRLRLQGDPGAAPGGRALPDRLRDDLRRPAATASRSSATRWTSTAGRCWAARSSPSWGCRPRTTAAPSTSACAAGLDFTKDDENVNSQPFMRWRDRFALRRRGDPQGRGRDGRAQGPLPERDRAHAGGDVQARRVRQGARHADHHARLPHRRLLRQHGAGELVPRQRRCCCTSTAPCTR